MSLGMDRACVLGPDRERAKRPLTLGPIGIAVWAIRYCRQAGLPVIVVSNSLHERQMK